MAEIQQIKFLKMQTAQSDAGNDPGSLALTVVNPAINNLPQIYVNTSATLLASISNNTGSDVVLSQQSTIEIYMPSYFTSAEVTAMSIDSFSVTGWSFRATGDGGLLLSFTNAAGTFRAGSVLSFKIENVLSTASPASDTVQVNFNNMTGANLPSQVTTTFGLLAAPVAGNADLLSTLQVALNNEELFVSVASDPISNTLSLNFKNTGNNPLYDGTSMWQGNPQVAITFAYGNTSGAVAPSAKSAGPALGSAWNISASVSVDQTAGWQVSNPSLTDGSNSPVWILSPVNSNQQIIGIDTNANVTFTFSNIYSFTPVGSTQMYIQFSGFSQNENTLYNDVVFVVDIDKESNPVRGLQALSSQTPYCYTTAINGATASTVVSLGWEAKYVGKVVLQYVILNRTTPPPPSPFSTTYPNNNSPAFDSKVLTIDNVMVGDQLQFTMYAYEADGVTEINSKQFSITVEQQADAYSFSGPGSDVSYNLNQDATFNVNWKVFNAASVKIYSSFSGVSTCEKTYSSPDQWITDSGSLSVSNLTTTVSIPLTLEAYDGNSVLLNSMQCSVNFYPGGWCDPKDGQVYPMVKLNNQLWMGTNYNYQSSPYNASAPDAIPYNNDPTMDPTYGLFYLYETAISNAPDGWRLASDSDWNGLLSAYGTACAPYLPGGSIGLNLPLGGAQVMQDDAFVGAGILAFYWSQATDPTQSGIVLLGQEANTISLNDMSIQYLIRLTMARYIKND